MNKCKQCNKLFEWVYNPQERICSQECRIIMDKNAKEKDMLAKRRQRALQNPNIVPVELLKEKKCPYCPKVFRPRDFRQIACSKQCGLNIKTANNMRIFRERHGRDSALNRKYNIARKYGISTDEYNVMYEKQNGLCAICKSPDTKHKHKNLFIDHCHITNKVRGLLCHPCNIAIGNFKDSPTILQSAIDYLQK